MARHCCSLLVSLLSLFVTQPSTAARKEQSPRCASTDPPLACPTAKLLLQPEVIRRIACRSDQWRRDLPETLESLYSRTANSLSLPAVEGAPIELRRGSNAPWHATLEPANRFKVLPNAMVPSDHSALREFGHGDEAKQLMGLHVLPRCNVLSIGSRLSYKFEAEIINATNCIIHVTDCTVGPPTDSDELTAKQARIPAALAGRIRHWRFCIAAEDHVVSDQQLRSDSNRRQGGVRKFLSFASLVRRVGVSFDAVKMDVEGFEYSVLHAMLAAPKSQLPTQVAFELHWQTQMRSLSWHGRAKTTGEIAMLALSLHDAGYRPVARQLKHKGGCPWCQELTYLRVFCPSG